MDGNRKQNKLLELKKVQNAEKRPRYGMRKLSIGLVSCMLGTLIVTPGALQPDDVYGQASVKTSVVEKKEIKDAEAVPEVEKNAVAGTRQLGGTPAIGQSQVAKKAQIINNLKKFKSPQVGANVPPKNIVEKINWDTEEAKSDAYFPLNQQVGVAPFQRPVRVSDIAEPIKVWDINYMG